MSGLSKTMDEVRMLDLSGAGWTTPRVAALRMLWLNGFSASEIARQLSRVSRNAVIGKAHRIGLCGRTAPARPVAKRRPPKSVRPRLVAPPAKVTRPAPMANNALGAPTEPLLVEDRPVNIAALRAGMCRFPMGDPDSPGFAFCARATRDKDCPYCPGHARVCYQRNAKPAASSPEGKLRQLVRAMAARRGGWR